MSLTYGWQQLFGCVHAMAQSTEPPWKRLARAVGAGLNIINPDEDLPNELREEWRSIIAATTNKPDRGEGTIEATCSQLTELEATKLIGRIVELHNAVTLELGDSRTK